MVAGETQKAMGSPRLAGRPLAVMTEQTVFLTCTPTPPGAAPSPGDAVKVRRMRRVGRALLRQWGCSCLAPTAEVLISELMTNALVHGSSTRVKFKMALTEDSVRIEVDDGSPASRARMRKAGSDDESGRAWLSSPRSPQAGVWPRMPAPPGAR